MPGKQAYENKKRKEHIICQKQTAEFNALKCQSKKLNTDMYKLSYCSLQTNKPKSSFQLLNHKEQVYYTQSSTLSVDQCLERLMLNQVLWKQLIARFS